MAIRPNELPVILDEPNVDPGLGYSGFVEGIAAAIRGAKSSRFTMGLFGPWGIGKSSLLASLKKELSSRSTDEAPMYVVDFNAWRYQHVQRLIVPLLTCVKAEINEAERKASPLKGFLSRAVRSVELSAFGLGVKLGSDGNSEVGESDIEQAERLYLEPFSELQRVSQGLEEANARIVVLVDDLDRCSPNTIIEVIEAIHMLTDLERFVFVLALDYDYLKDAVRSHYPTTDPDKFIEKLVQVPFSIPPVHIDEKSVSEIVGAPWSKIADDWFDDVTGSMPTIEEIIRRSLRSNPRQVKRLLNMYLLTRYMNWDATAGNEGLLLAILGFQIGWDKEFKEFTGSIEKELRERRGIEAAEVVTIGDLENVHDLFVDSSDYSELERQRFEQIREYRDQFLGSSTELSKFTSIVRLTEQVGATNISSSTVADVDEVSRFRRALNAAGKEVIDSYEELLSFARNYDLPSPFHAEISEKDTSLGVRVLRPESVGRVFASFVIRSRESKLLLYVDLPDAAVGEWMNRAVAESGTPITDFRNKGHHGTGQFEFVVEAASASESRARQIEFAKKLIVASLEFSLSHKRVRGA